MEFTEQEKKVLADKYETFKEEIELAMIQNCIVECELYSLLAEIIRGTKSGKKISLRDVSVRRKTKLSMWLHGAAGFPDFVVLERKKGRDARRYGCVEIKCPGKSNILRITKQVKGHIISYGRVIYTNGLQWKFYRVDKSRNKNDGGSGLGLAITKSIVSLHGGIITAQSDGEKTIFKVMLPLLKDKIKIKKEL